ncbi:hypothetical protein J3E07_001572 [Methanococcus voltae]|uniref:Uncharacterized protein n=1 Tax=Methanococcus voltae TaxID=2188 RepID=A0A8J7RNG8_METVO|nr:hypothetical protein [Methanococcus voltae]MBP2202131.1 hypothetical protein [Methanococcus voltae]
MVSIDEYVNATTKTVKLPSGFEFKIKTISSYDLIEQFQNPALFEDMMNLSNDEIKNNQKTNKLNTKNPESQIGLTLFEKIPILVENNIVEPAGIKWNQLSGEDKEFLANEIVMKQLSVSKNVSTFRKE